MKRIVTPVLVILLCIVCMTRPIQAQNQGNQLPKVSAKGEYTVTIDATKAVINFQISRTASTAKEASAKNDSVAKEIVGFLKTNSLVKKLATTGISLTPVTKYDNTTNEAKVIGYQASNSLQFETMISKAGEILDVIIQKGANQITGVTFTAEEDVIEDAHMRALAEATKKAKSNAEIAANAIGVSPRGVQTIIVGQNQYFSPMLQDHSKLHAQKLLLFKGHLQSQQLLQSS